MNLIEYVQKHGIKTKDSEEFEHSPEFHKMQEFKKTLYTVYSIPFLTPETEEVKEFNVMLKGSVREKWDKAQKKTKREFLIQRSFKYPHIDEFIEDEFDAGETIEEAIFNLETEKQWFEFFHKHDLIDTGRYWLDRDLKRCLVDNGQVIVIDE